MEYNTHSEKRMGLWKKQILCKIMEESSQFLSSQLLCELKKLEVALNIAGVKKAVQRACDHDQYWNIGGYLIWIRKALLMVKICVLCGWWFSSAFEIVPEILSSYNTDSHELLYPETNWNINLCQKARWCVYFKKPCSVVMISPHTNLSKQFEDWEKLNFWNKLIL